MPITPPVRAAMDVMSDAAASVPAYQAIYREQGFDPARVGGPEQFTEVPLTDKDSLFQRFPVQQLCRGGRIGRLASVLTSSGHSGKFSFGLYDAATAPAEAQRVDDMLDAFFQVRSRPTLLINCLPMGVTVPTQACTLAQTSVRPDMVVALAGQFARHYEQIILVADPGFCKHVLELGGRHGVDWAGTTVHLILGEEVLAENARAYFGQILETDGADPQRGLIASSMGVAEAGLNLFFELPDLIRLRQALHADAGLRHKVCPNHQTVPSLLVYDQRRLYVEVLADGRLVLTTLQPRPIPLVRYVTGDKARWPDLSAVGEALGGEASMPEPLAPIAVLGRDGAAVRAGDGAISPEQIKEGLYAEADLARRTTANFRLAGGPGEGRVRIQLQPGIDPDPSLDERFAAAVAGYVGLPLQVRCEAYETFGSQMTLDYERKFAYLDE